MDQAEETPRWRDEKFLEDAYAPPLEAPATNLAGQVRVVAVLMIVQGVLESLGGLLLVGVAIMFPLFADMARAEDPEMAEMPTALFSAMYGVFGGGLFLIGALRAFAGWRNYHFRNKTLGIVAVSIGLATVMTCYCAPTSIGLAIYALIVYLNPAAAAAFQEAGSSAPGVRKIAGESPFGSPE